MALRLPTSRAYARTAFARVRLLDVDWYEDVIDAEPVDESTRYVWRFEFDQGAGVDAKPDTLRRDAVFPDRSVRVQQLHCVHGGGYVLCDGCDRPHHIRCADVDPNVWERTNPGSAATQPGAVIASRDARHTKKTRAGRATRTRRNAPRNRGVRARGTRVDSVFRGCRTEERTRALTIRGWLEHRRMDDARLQDVSSTTPTLSYRSAESRAETHAAQSRGGPRRDRHQRR